MIKKILIANRGEIAVRIMRACSEMGIVSVAVYSDDDRSSMHVLYADEAYHIGPSPSNESYLVIDKIIDVAKKSKADAIHPGYGFLSENAEFSDRCKEEGIIFIGPSSKAISSMGDKITARVAMISSGVPVVPGTKEDITSDEMAKQVLEEVGLPIMIKASAGGGGKGMRLVRAENEFMDAFRAAKSEAKAAFGNDQVYVEKYIESPHHIEFQVLADKHGNVIHLCERECSVQRRHQKVVEETPSPIMIQSVRDEMGKCAVAAAKAVDYEGAGTIEFLVDNDLNYYFLEMNTRLQVEHPVTEMVTGVDLVKEQINIAAGEVLQIKQEDISQNGHAIECRIYAEDPYKNFMPSPGVVKQITEPKGIGIRVDGYAYPGFKIPIHYDPMISKLIVWGTTREESINRMKRALSEYKISGIKTSIRFLERIMKEPDFCNGKYNTHFIEKNEKNLFEKEKSDSVREDLVIMATYFDYMKSLSDAKPDSNVSDNTDAWKNYGRRKAVNRF